MDGGHTWSVMLILFLAMLFLNVASIFAHRDEVAGVKAQVAAIQAQAVQRGYAVYRVGKDNTPEFAWKEQAEATK